MWRGPTEITPHFTSVKPTCTGRRPNEPIIAEDFTHTVANIRKLANMLQLKEKTTRRGLLTDWSSQEPKIKFRHILFTVSSNMLTVLINRLT